MGNTEYLPVANPTPSFWHSEADDFRNTRTTPDLPEEVDVLIVGAGYAGASVTYWLYDQQPTTPPSVLMLEARFVCSGATGRNGGHLKPDYYRGYKRFEKAYGLKDAASIGNFEHAHLAAVKEAVEKLNIDCDFVLTRACNVHLTHGAIESCKDSIAALRKNPYCEVQDDIQVLEGDNARITSGVVDSPISVTFTAGQLWPYKLIKGLLEWCITKGLNLQTNTPVLDISQQSDGTYLVTTERGIVKAKKVVLGTNAYTVSVAPEFNDKIVPVKGTCSHIVTTDGPAPYLTNTYGVCRDFNENEYLINRPDGGVIVGGAKPFYIKEKDSWYNSVDDSTLFAGDVKKWYSTFMQDTYYTWKGRKTDVDYLWTGILGYSVDGVPFVGEVPGKKNEYILAGFHGHGMPRVFLSAKAIAQMVLKGVDVSETGIPKPFWLTKKRLDAAKNTILQETGFTRKNE